MSRFCSGSKRCRAVRDVENGSWKLVTSSSTSGSVRGGYRFGSVVQYSCSEGYSLLGPVERVCQENSTWSDVSPTCHLSGMDLSKISDALGR